MELTPFRDRWEPQDPHANFKAEVAAYTTTNPLPALEGLSDVTGIPVGCLARYVLVKWAASAPEALLAMEPIVFRQMRHHVEHAEQEGTDSARLQAYESLRQMIAWLSMAEE